MKKPWDLMVCVGKCPASAIHSPCCSRKLVFSSPCDNADHLEEVQLTLFSLVLTMKSRVGHCRKIRFHLFLRKILICIYVSN